MASLSKDGNGWRILFVCPATGKRHTVRTGRCARKNAETARNMIEKLVEARSLGAPIDGQTAEWLKAIDDKMRGRLAKAGRPVLLPEVTMTRAFPRRPAPSFWLAPFLALAIGSPAVAQEGKARLTLDRYLSWEDVRNPQLSPDGTQLVYERRWVNAIDDRWDSALWLMGADGGRNRFLAKGSSPRWSPDGTRVAYLAKGEPKGTQVFVRWLDAEGAGSQVTRVIESPSNIRWSPDGDSIAFQMVVPKKKDKAWRIDMPDQYRTATSVSG